MNNVKDKSDPLISVVIPTYNRAKYLDKCLRSVLIQTDCDFEVIVSDNASPDNTPAVINGFLSDERIRYLRNKSNLGILENIYQVTRAARGQYIFYLSDDDYLLPGDRK